MQSTGRSTTTTLNVNKHVDCNVPSQQSFFAKASFKTMQDLILYAVRLLSLTIKNFSCCLTFSNGKISAFRTKVIQLST